MLAPNHRRGHVRCRSLVKQVSINCIRFCSVKANVLTGIPDLYLQRLYAHTLIIFLKFGDQDFKFGGLCEETSIGVKCRVRTYGFHKKHYSITLLQLELTYQLQWQS